MLHRISKANDVNRDKWIGVGGHFENGESPGECMLREVKEETNLTLTKWRFHGIVTFIQEDICEYMFLYTATEAEEGLDAPLPACDEGRLEWVDIARIPSLPLWEGDHIFLKLIAEDAPVFFLKLNYSRDGVLLASSLNFAETTPDNRQLQE